MLKWKSKLLTCFTYFSYNFWNVSTTIHIRKTKLLKCFSSVPIMKVYIIWTSRRIFITSGRYPIQANSICPIFLPLNDPPEVVRNISIEVIHILTAGSLADDLYWWPIPSDVSYLSICTHIHVRVNHRQCRWIFSWFHSRINPGNNFQFLS